MHGDGMGTGITVQKVRGIGWDGDDFHPGASLYFSVVSSKED